MDGEEERISLRKTTDKEEVHWTARPTEEEKKSKTGFFSSSQDSLPLESRPTYAHVQNLLGSTMFSSESKSWTYFEIKFDVGVTY